MHPQDNLSLQNANWHPPKLGARQRSGDGCPKGCFWMFHFFSAPLEFSGVVRANLKGTEKKRTLQKHAFGRPFLRTTPSPLLWHPPKCKLGRGDFCVILYNNCRLEVANPCLVPISLFLERPCEGQQGGSMLLRREGGRVLKKRGRVLKKRGRFLRRGV